jgi:hypothetical protein
MVCMPEDASTLGRLDGSGGGGRKWCRFRPLLRSRKKPPLPMARLVRCARTMGAIMRKFLIGLAGCVFLSVPANAEGSADQFLNNQNPKLAETLLNAIATGISASNSHVDKRMYCPPGNLAITSQQYMEILRQFIQQNPRMGGYPAASVMIRALNHTFPCQNR